MLRQRTFYIPHGGGSCFFMPDPQRIWTGMAAFLRTILAMLPERPHGLLIVPGHWEKRSCFAFTASPRPDLIKISVTSSDPLDADGGVRGYAEVDFRGRVKIDNDHVIVRVGLGAEGILETNRSGLPPNEQGTRSRIEEHDCYGSLHSQIGESH